MVVEAHMLYDAALRMRGVGAPSAWLALACPRALCGFTLLIRPRQMPPQLLRAFPHPTTAAVAVTSPIKKQIECKDCFIPSKVKQKWFGDIVTFFFLMLICVYLYIYYFI